MIRIFITVIVCLSACISTSFSQEVNVAPEINNNYKSGNLDVAQWAERFTGESREVYIARFEIIDVIDIQKGDRIADIGAGTGLYTQLFANATGPDGHVYSVDIAQQFLDFIDLNAEKDGLSNITTVLGEDKTTNLSDASADIVFLSDVYHHFEFPRTMVRDLARLLVPGGEMFIIDYQRIPGVTPQGRLDHVRAGKETVIEEIESSGFSMVEEVNLPSLSENYMLHFQKN
ncbi:MAG: class I SAM-dependent methyltransferase [Proteobacteria bacterium]|jgi:ubiquinone/menaquinone biosynthesis C-methylase UbiE|nr:class I SAM-dependent methyltransferase [Pseudomonadota bacterium]